MIQPIRAQPRRIWTNESAPVCSWEESAEVDSQDGPELSSPANIAQGEEHLLHTDWKIFKNSKSDPTTFTEIFP